MGDGVAPGWLTGAPEVRVVGGRVSGRASGRARKTDHAAQDRPMASTAARTTTWRGDKVQRASRSRSGRIDSGIHPPRTSSSRSSSCSSGARAARRASARSRAPGLGAGARRVTFTPEKVRVRGRPEPPTSNLWKTGPPRDELRLPADVVTRAAAWGSPHNRYPETFRARRKEVSG